MHTKIRSFPNLRAKVLLIFDMTKFSAKKMQNYQELRNF